ncbi:MAG: hypothetical protein ACI9SC_000912, partial [Gammaproteobacteria bacterium]
MKSRICRVTPHWLYRQLLYCKCPFPLYLYRFFLVLIISGQSNVIFANEPQITIHPTDTAPELDGVLDDETWKGATRVTEFYQREPVEGAAASEKTEAYLTYDSDMLYVGVRMHDSNAGGIVAHELRENEKMLG